MKNIDIILGLNCNLNCIFCEPSGKLIEKSNTEKLLKIIKSLNAKGFESINFSGGEPILDKNLSLYIKFAKKIGYKIIGIQTNLIIENNFLESLIKDGINKIGFTYFGNDLDKFSKITQNGDLFQIYKSSLEYISKIKGNVNIHSDIVLNEFLINDLRSEINTLTQYGVNYIKFKFPIPLGKVSPNNNLEIYSDILKNTLKDKIGFDYGILYFPTCYLDGFEDKIYPMDNDYIYDGKYFFSLKDSVENKYKQSLRCEKCIKEKGCYGFVNDYNNKK